MTAGSTYDFAGATFTYQWQTDGGGGTDGAAGTLTNISGATSATLTVSTSATNFGTYYYDVVITDNTSAQITGTGGARDRAGGGFRRVP